MSSRASPEQTNQNSTANNSTPLSSFRRGILSRISSRSKSSQQKANVERENSVNKNEHETRSDLHVFQSHWQEVRAIISLPNNVAPHGVSSHHGSSSSDDCLLVVDRTSEMVRILTRKAEPSDPALPTFECDSRILDYFYSEDVLDRLLRWAVSRPELEEQMNNHLLGLFSSILSLRSCQIFIDRQILSPLFRLILNCASIDKRKLYENRLAEVFNHFCFGVSQYSEVIEVLFSDNYIDLDAGGHTLISVLLCFIHWDGTVGEQARDMLKITICFASNHTEVATYFVSKSNLCPILATGLTGLYSSLPRTLTYTSDDWSGISEEDINDSLDLQRFLTSLKFCDDIIKILLPPVRQQLLDFIYNGFLVPVIAPGLHQGTSGVEEVIATTSYLNLFINKITEPLLLQIFLKFILQVKVDEFSILDILIRRITNPHPKLCIITLVLFKTLVQLNCEDVMYHLVFKYLIPCTHVMISQQRSIESMDLYCKNAEKILALVPSCCDISSARSESHTSTINALCDNVTEPREDALSPLERSKWWQSIRRKKTPLATRHSVGDIKSSVEPSDDSFETSYFEYLHLARSSIDLCRNACKHWSRSYTRQSADQLATAEPLKASSAAPHSMNSDVDLHDSKGLHGGGGITRDLCFPNVNAMTEAELKISNESTDVMRNDHSQISANSSDLPGLTFHRGQSALSHLQSSAVFSASLLEDNSSFLSHLDAVSLPEQPDEGFQDIGSVTSCKDGSKPVDEEKNDVRTAIMSCSAQAPANKNKEEILHSNVIDAASTGPLTNVVASDYVKKCKEFERWKFVDATSQENSTRPMSLNLDGFDSDVPTSLSPSPSMSFKNFSVSPTIGPFLKTLLQRLELMKQNTFYVNLHLTELIARLACYPQPLLTSVLLSQTIVFQPSVKSLAQVLNSVKCRLEEYFLQVTDKDFMMVHAMHYLRYRIGQLRLEPKLSIGDARSSLFGRRSSLSNKPLTLLGTRQGARYSTANPSPAQSFVTNDSPEFLEKKNAIYCALVLKEFVKELAAISQEHTVSQLRSS